MAMLDEIESDDDAPPKPAPPAEKKVEETPKKEGEVTVEKVTESLAAATVGAPAKEDEEAEPKGGFKMSFGKKSKKQLQKEKKEAEAKKRYEEAKDSMKDWDDPKGMFNLVVKPRQQLDSCRTITDTVSSQWPKTSVLQCNWLRSV